MRKHRTLWVVLFILAVLLLGVLATGWNVVLMEQMRNFELPPVPSPPRPDRWTSIVLGTLGFVGLLGGIILFFVRLLREMRLNQLQSEFIAAVSHELKTPIATLELSSSLLRAGELTEDETTRLWASHQAELSRLRDQVESLLEAAQWQARALQPTPRRLRLEDWIAESCGRWREILGPGARLEREGPALDFEVETDPKILGRIMESLLDNARKFAKERPEVTVVTEATASGWTLGIRDRGWGFSPEDSQRIFGRFVRVRNPAPYAIGGSGLGLYLAATASRALGLELSARTEGPGRGAVFTLHGTAPRDPARPCGGVSSGPGGR
jgi:signal transduction histidine kinase